MILIMAMRKGMEINCKQKKGNNVEKVFENKTISSKRNKPSCSSDYMRNYQNMTTEKNKEGKKDAASDEGQLLCTPACCSPVTV